MEKMRNSTRAITTNWIRSDKENQWFRYVDDSSFEFVDVVTSTSGRNLVIGKVIDVEEYLTLEMDFVEDALFTTTANCTAWSVDEAFEIYGYTAPFVIAQAIMEKLSVEECDVIYPADSHEEAVVFAIKTTER